MSSNTPMMDSTEDKSQEKTMAENKKTSENKSGTDSTETEKTDDICCHWRSEERVAADV